MLNIKSLKKNRQTALDKLSDELSRIKSNAMAFTSDDDRFWYPEVDKAGNGFAMIRFLPQPDEEDSPFVRIFSHSFQGPTGQWYIENCPTTLGRQCPCCTHNSSLWNSGSEKNKQLASKQKRKLTFISNIFVLKDPANPTNEGKVKIFRYGKKIYDKINDLMFPPFEGETKVNPFDLWEGASLRLKIRTVSNYRNYDQSAFDAPTPLFSDDDELEKIQNVYGLMEFVAADKFKSQEELSIKLHNALGLNGTSNKAVATVKDDLPWDDNKAASSASDDDEDLAMFKALADDD